MFTSIRSAKHTHLSQLHTHAHTHLPQLEHMNTVRVHTHCHHTHTRTHTCPSWHTKYVHQQSTHTHKLVQNASSSLHVWLWVQYTSYILLHPQIHTAQHTIRTPQCDITIGGSQTIALWHHANTNPSTDTVCVCVVCSWPMGLWAFIPGPHPGSSPAATSSPAAPPRWWPQCTK